jgi:hypothetical protein
MAFAAVHESEIGTTRKVIAVHQIRQLSRVQETGLGRADDDASMAALDDP